MCVYASKGILRQSVKYVIEVNTSTHIQFYMMLRIESNGTSHFYCLDRKENSHRHRRIGPASQSMFIFRKHNNYDE